MVDRPRRPVDRLTLIIGLVVVVLVACALVISWLVVRQPTLEPVPVASVSQA